MQYWPKQEVSLEWMYKFTQDTNLPMLLICKTNKIHSLAQDRTCFLFHMRVLWVHKMSGFIS